MNLELGAGRATAVVTDRGEDRRSAEFTHGSDTKAANVHDRVGRRRRGGTLWLIECLLDPKLGPHLPTPLTQHATQRVTSGSAT